MELQEEAGLELQLGSARLSLGQGINVMLFGWEPWQWGSFKAL